MSFHGAGGAASHGIALLREEADQFSFAVLAPSSAASTWDAVTGSFGPDVETARLALEAAAERVAFDDTRVAVAGFSDGASYALSIGLTNGDVLRSIVAFSPGFSAATAPRGRPRIFVAHGTDDRVLDIERTSRRIVSQLRTAYDVTYVEFHGGHEVPTDVRVRAAAWLSTA